MKNNQFTLLIMFFMAMVGAYAYHQGLNVMWGGYWAIVAFYGFIFWIGNRASFKHKASASAESSLVAGREMPLFLSVFTMAATWIDGGYINGSAEYTANTAYGMLWVQAPWGYALSLFIGGLVFAMPMRRKRYLTMMDPLNERYGKNVAAVLTIPALLGELFWTAAILKALGVTFAVVSGMDCTSAILISAVVCIAYAATGGLWAVAITDVVLIVTILIGLTLVVAGALPSVGGAEHAWTKYSQDFGSKATLLPSREALGTSWWSWWDAAFLLILGGIPWQVYFQRVLSARNETTARNLSWLGAVVCLVVAVPSIALGVIGYVYGVEQGWQSVGLSQTPDAASIAPHVMRYLTHPVIATIGLGAIAAAVMSSVAASVISASSLLGWNIIKPLYPQSERINFEKLLRWSTLGLGFIAVLMAIQASSVYALWILCSDLVYCLLLPPLALALFDSKSNFRGAIVGLLVALLLRIGGGEPLLGIPALLPYPTDADGIIQIPFKGMAMLAGLFGNMLVSRIWKA